MRAIRGETMRVQSKLFHTLAAAAMLASALSMPLQEAAAQNVLGGALLGGAAGAVIGGAVTGRAGGAIIGGALGATTGALIAQSAQRRHNGYYFYRGECY